jgi:hypothetical protein
MPEKCEFHKERVRYLGLIISAKGISMNENKVETVRNGSREMKTENGQLNNLFALENSLDSAMNIGCIFLSNPRKRNH